MPSSVRRGELHPHIQAVVDETGEEDPFLAVRSKARAVVRDFYNLFAAPPPFNLEALASFRGLHSSDDAPRHSKDSEIAPQADGRVVLRVNRDRPRTRQRFSVGHEVGHTLFPEYQLAVRCRKGSEHDWADSSDLLETLCDVAASEFLFPEPWFPQSTSSLGRSAASLAKLASDYAASRDATVRRFVEVHPDPLAAVFISWKLKPSEIQQARRDRRQNRMFADELGVGPERKLRVDYGVTNSAFAKRCADHLPKDKSVPSEGAIYEASVAQEPCDGTSWLDLGSTQGNFILNALPIFTPESGLGPGGAVSVVAVIQPC